MGMLVFGLVWSRCSFVCILANVALLCCSMPRASSRWWSKHNMWAKGEKAAWPRSNRMIRQA